MAGVSIDIKWNKEEVIREVSNKIASNASVAGKYVEDVARSNLLAITEPSEKRYANYRRYLATSKLTHVVSQEGKAVVVEIGFMGGSPFGFYIETGSSTAGAQPYLRPALNSSIGAVIGILSG